MNKGSKLYEGKAKIIYETKDKNLFNFSYHTKKINIIFNRSLKKK